VQPDHTDDETIDARNNKTGPHLPSDQDRRNNGEKTREIVQLEHRHRGPPIFIAARHEYRNLRAKGATIQRKKWLEADDKEVNEETSRIANVT
jgi:hypothetical protein